MHINEFICNASLKGNKLFPDEITLEPTGITIKIPGLFSGESTHFDFNHIASVEIDTPMIGFSTITIFAGGTKMSANGFTKAEVKQIKEEIEAGKKAATGSGSSSLADEITILRP